MLKVTSSLCFLKCHSLFSTASVLTPLISSNHLAATTLSKTEGATLSFYLEFSRVPVMYKVYICIPCHGILALHRVALLPPQVSFLKSCPALWNVTSVTAKSAIRVPTGIGLPIPPWPFPSSYPNLGCHAQNAFFFHSVS